MKIQTIATQAFVCTARNNIARAEKDAQKEQSAANGGDDNDDESRTP